jgi:hypothetical protein
LVHNVDIDPQLISNPPRHTLDRSRRVSGHDDGKSGVRTRTLLRHPTQQLPEHRVDIEADRNCTSLRLCEDPLAALVRDWIDELDLTLGCPALACRKVQKAWMTRFPARPRLDNRA